MTGFPRAFAAAAALLFATAGVLAAQPDSFEIRHRRVGNWLIEYVAESDGGRVVRMSRRAEAGRLQFEVAFWHGNDGRIQAMLVERSDCANGEEIGRHVVLDAPALRALFAAALEGCAVPPRRIDAALAGIEPAYALAAAWTDEAEAATAAEAQAIADYGAGNDIADGIATSELATQETPSTNDIAPTPE